MATGFAGKFRSNSQGEATTQALSAFVTLTRTPPKLTRCQTCHVTKCSSEISLAGKVERECNIDQGLISSYQQRFGTLETRRADVLVRRLTNGSLDA